jgi:hypothetical protein
MGPRRAAFLVSAARVVRLAYWRGFEFYKGLFGQIEDLINGKRLLIVPGKSNASDFLVN